MFWETTVERHTFRCAHCRQEWTRDYDVVHVTLADGSPQAYYTRGGLPEAAPVAPRSVMCPGCGAEQAQVNFVDRQAAEDQLPAAASWPPGARTHAAPVEAARQAAQALERLAAAATEADQPGGLSRVGDIKAVTEALQKGLTTLPQLLHQLGNALKPVQGQPNPHHAGHVPEAIRALEHAAHSARELTGPITGELSRARTALTTLEAVPLHAAATRHNPTASHTDQ